MQPTIYFNEPTHNICKTVADGNFHKFSFSSDNFLKISLTFGHIWMETQLMLTLLNRSMWDKNLCKCEQRHKIQEREDDTTLNSTYVSYSSLPKQSTHFTPLLRVDSIHWQINAFEFNQSNVLGFAPSVVVNHFITASRNKD